MFMIDVHGFIFSIFFLQHSIKYTLHCRKFDISWTNVVAFTSDNCNVMKGTNNSVFSRIKAVQPDVFDVGCICHLPNLCCGSAVKQLPISVDDLLIGIYFHFNKRKHLVQIINYNKVSSSNYFLKLFPLFIVIKYFSSHLSDKRVEEFKQFAAFTVVDSLKIQKHCTTLALRNVLKELFSNGQPCSRILQVTSMQSELEDV